MMKLHNNEWYAQFCNLAAANVLDKEGNIRFDSYVLQRALDDAWRGDTGLVPKSIVELKRNIIEACNRKYPNNDWSDQDGETLLLVLLNIQAGYHQACGLLHEDKGGGEETSECGFEIF